MDIVHKVVFVKKEGKLFITTTLQDDGEEKHSVNYDEIDSILKDCKNFIWNQSPQLQKEIGKQLYNILDGDLKLLTRSLKKASNDGKCLQLSIQNDEYSSYLPFELLYYESFLVTDKIHLIRHVSDWGCEMNPESKNQPLKILFMACSPEGLSPVLEYEKEEEMIYQVTKNLPVMIDVEDTGSLDGLKDRIEQTVYDVIHLSGHASIDDKGEPFFWMEDETGLPQKVNSSELWGIVKLNKPRLLFLSGCHTGASPPHESMMSFAHNMVDKHCSAVLGWGLPVSDPDASLTAEILYYELSRGQNILDSVSMARSKLKQIHSNDWSILRLFSDGTPLIVPMVKPGQKKRPQPRRMKHTSLKNSKVKILESGFIGRRRQIQKSLRALRQNNDKIGILLHGTGGLGKSCLAGKIIERLTDYELIIVHGELKSSTFHRALKEAFYRAGDEQGKTVMNEEIKIQNKIQILCSTSFLRKNYLILFDDFEQNMPGIGNNDFNLTKDAIQIMETLLKYLPNSNKMTQLIITSRYGLSLTNYGEDIVGKRLEIIGLTSFQGADQIKKVKELVYLSTYPDPEIREHLIHAGCGNPRLMEEVDTLLGVENDLDVSSILSEIKDKQEEFIQKLLLRKILYNQTEEFQKFLKYTSVFQLPVTKEGIAQVCTPDIINYEINLNEAVRLSLIEQYNNRKDSVLYWVTPLLRDDIFSDLEVDENIKCHREAVTYYKEIVDGLSNNTPELEHQLIIHAIKSDLHDIATEYGCNLLRFLRTTLSYNEALYIGNLILKSSSYQERTDILSGFYYEIGYLMDDIGQSKKALAYYDKALDIDKEMYGDRHQKVASILNQLGLAWYHLGDSNKAVELFEQALDINKEVYGNRHQEVASTINNLGLAWDNLGDSNNAVEYFQQALDIDKEMYGDKHQKVATDLNNLGLAWKHLGDSKKAVEYYEQALDIVKRVYGDRHPKVATRLHNIGSALDNLGDSKKAVVYFEQALDIGKETYGERHPKLASILNQLGLALDNLGDSKKAVVYFEQALDIVTEVYGDRHPDVAINLNNLGLAWQNLGDSKKAMEYYKQALSIGKEVYGDRHPKVATYLNNLGSAWVNLGESKKAVEYFEQALDIGKEVYGDRHPNVATDLNNLGSAWKHLGDLKKAVAYYEQALSIGKEVYGDRHPKVATYLNNLGSAWVNLGESKKGVEYYNQALDIVKEAYGERHPSVATCLNNLGSAWDSLGESKKAVEYYEQALDIDMEEYGGRHPSVATYLNNLGSAWNHLGESKKAIEYFKQALDIVKELYGHRHPYVASTLNNLGSAWDSLGESKKAVEYYEQAYEIFRIIYGDDHPLTINVKSKLKIDKIS